MRFRHLICSISVFCFAVPVAGCSGVGLQPTSAPGMRSQPAGRPVLPEGVAIQAASNSVALSPAHSNVVKWRKPTPFVNVAAIERSGRNLVAFSDSDANEVLIQGAHSGFYAELTTGLNEPQGLAFNTEGALYVANTNDSQVLAYAKPYTKATATLSDSGQYPVGVAVALDGTVGVTNISSTEGGAGSVAVFAKGATSPCAIVGNSSFVRVYFDAFDKAGNLFVDGTDAGGRYVVGKVTGECRARSIVPLSIRTKIALPGGVAVLSNGDVALGDQADTNVTSIVYTYKPPSGGSLGSPTKITTLKAVYDAVTFAFTQSDRSLWIADAGAGDFAKYRYPAGGEPLTAFANFEQPAGVAVYPPQH
jgi:hypothetical protein